MKYHAAVVKHEATINQGAKPAELIRQISEAFAVRFKISDSPDDHTVSSVYVFNSGKITDNAKTYLRSELDKRDYGSNVHIFDGERLHQLDLIGDVRRREVYLPGLRGLIAALIWNEAICRAILQNLPTIASHSGMLTRPIEDFLASPSRFPKCR